MGELLVVKICECLIFCKPYLFPLLTFGSCSFFTDTERFHFPRNIYLCWYREFMIYLHNMWLSLKRDNLYAWQARDLELKPKVYKKHFKICKPLYFYQVLIVIKTNQNNRALLYRFSFLWLFPRVF